MVFPQYNYKNFHNGNKEQWPMQPPTNENWFKMYQESYNYCKQLKDIFEFEGVCKDVELPSFHPFWTLEVFKGTIKLIDRTIEAIKETQDYIDSGGYHKEKAKNSISLQKKSLVKYCSSLNFR